MHAIRIHSYGKAEMLRYEEVARPSPGPADALIRVRAAGVNQMDWKLRAGFLRQFFDPPLPIVPGGEIAGVVESVGSDVRAVAVNDEVFGFIGFLGGYAEYVAAPAALLVRRPKALSANVAAAVSVSAQTAVLALTELAGLESGQRVFIHAAAGGVGQFAVQLARLKNAYIVGTASAANLARLRSLGADEAIDYSSLNLAHYAKSFDVVFDLIGGDTGAASLSLLKPGGILLGATAPPDSRASAAAGVRSAFVAVNPDPARLGRIRDQLERNELTLPEPILFKLRDAAAAHALSEGGHAPARIVLTMD